MPSDEQKRHAVRQAYPGKRWQDRVDAMSDKQVAAVYIRLLSNNKL